MNHRDLVKSNTLLFEELITRQLVTSCLNCIEFKEPASTCLKWKMQPPLRVTMFGCPDHEFDIPF